MRHVPSCLAVDAGGDEFPVTGPEPRLSWRPPQDLPELMG